MAISFTQIPNDKRVPLAYVEIDNSGAIKGTPAMDRKAVVIGQRLPNGRFPAGKLTRITRAIQATVGYGPGSMLDSMVAALKKADSASEIWAVALDDDEAAQKAKGALAITGTVNSGGTLALYINGIPVKAKAIAEDTASVVAARLATAINYASALPVTATATEGTLAFECKWGGETGNDIDIRLNINEEETPEGLTVAITAMSGGTANPDITKALAALGDEWFNTIICPYTDKGNRTALEAELLDRWSATKQREAIAYTAYRGTHGETGNYGESGNNFLISCMGTNASPQPPYIWAAVNGILAHKELGIDPARPLQTVVLTGILPPDASDAWRDDERELLLQDGISTYMVQNGGTVAIERQITMYQTNAYGLPDPSYLDVMTPATAGYIRYAIRSRITQKFGRHKLADDGTRFSPGQAIVTPSIIKAELVVLARELEEKGLMENVDAFKSALIVERNADDRNRLDVLLEPDFVNQFMIFAALLRFIL